MSTTTKRFAPATKKQLKVRICLSGLSGSGKAQPLTEPVLTPTGWRCIGDLAVGDPVCMPDGSAAPVKAVFQRGMLPVYAVTTSDGRTIKCCSDHLWLTQSPADRSAKRRGEVKSLKQIVEVGLLDANGKHNNWLPMTAPVTMLSEGPRPLDPYLLGVLLGDGNFTQGSVSISQPDDGVRNEISKVLPFGIDLREQDSLTYFLRRTAPSGANPAAVALETLGLRGKHSYDKFVPKQYLYSPISVRTRLLAGLLDTDGFANGATCEYGTSSPQLAEDVRFLVESLGGTVALSSRIPTYDYLGEKRNGRRAWRLNIKLPGNPFGYSKKAARYTPRTKYPPGRYIDSVEPAGVEECVCIEVDHSEHLYLTRGCVVTHNTMSALKVAQGLGERIALIDTENRSASLYANEVPFDTLAIDSFEPEHYTSAIEAAESEGYDVIIIDSLSHAWMGKGGMLEQVDNAAKANKGNSYVAWRNVTPKHNDLVDAIVRCKAHVIVTLRSKQEYALDKDEKGKATVKKLGMAPIFREGIEFEMTVAGDMNLEHDLVITKTRCPKLSGKAFNKPGKDLAKILKAWLDEGAPEEQAKPKSDDVSDGKVAGRVSTMALRLESTLTRDDLEKCGKEIAGWDDASEKAAIRPTYASRKAFIESKEANAFAQAKPAEVVDPATGEVSTTPAEASATRQPGDDADEVPPPPADTALPVNEALRKRILTAPSEEALQELVPELANALTGVHKDAPHPLREAFRSRKAELAKPTGPA